VPKHQCTVFVGRPNANPAQMWIDTMQMTRL